MTAGLSMAGLHRRQRLGSWARVDADPPRALGLSLEETPDLDGTAVEPLQDFVAEMSARGVQTMPIDRSPVRQAKAP